MSATQTTDATAANITEATAATVANNANAGTDAKLSESPEVQKDIADKLSKIPPSDYTVTDVRFGFRTVTNEKTKEKTKRPDVNLALPLITLNGVVNGLMEGDNKEKVQQWVVSLVNDAIIGMAREQVGDTEKPVNLQSELDISRLTMEAIALLPKSERTGGGISKETWTAFGEDYTAIMVNHGIKPEAVAKAVDLLVRRLAPCKTNKPALKKLAGYLDVWFTNSTEQEQFQDVYDFLKSKADTYMNADDAALAEAL